MPIKFYLDRRTNKYGESPIRLVWCFNGDRFQTTIRYSVYPGTWNESLRRVTSSNTNHMNIDPLLINKYLGSYEKAVNRMESEAQQINASLTKTIVKRVIDDVSTAGGDYPALKERTWIQMLKERRQSSDRYFVHFKGGRYKLIGFGKDSDTLRNVVIYQALYGNNEIWVRPFEVFFGKVKLPNGKEIPRYTEIR